jgi:hypothetical protein
MTKNVKNIELLISIINDRRKEIWQEFSCRRICMLPDQ